MTNAATANVAMDLDMNVIFMAFIFGLE
jgi:hypothetical protein